MTRTSKAEFEAIVDRVANMYADELTATDDDGEPVEFELFHKHESNVHRVCVMPKDPEHGSWQADLGPGFTKRKELEAFLRGMEAGKRVESTARL